MKKWYLGHNVVSLKNHLSKRNNIFFFDKIICSSVFENYFNLYTQFQSGCVFNVKSQQMPQVRCLGSKKGKDPVAS